jgi:spermidine/putrescine transport system ATP-binding protein
VTNFLPGTIAGSTAGGTLIDLGGARIAGPEDRRATIGQPVCVAVRPERIQLLTAQPTGEGPDTAAFAGTVRQVTYHGNCLRYVVNLSGDAIVVALEPCDVRDGAIAPGTRIWMRWNAQDAQIFPA